MASFSSQLHIIIACTDGTDVRLCHGVGELNHSCENFSSCAQEFLIAYKIITNGSDLILVIVGVKEWEI